MHPVFDPLKILRLVARLLARRQKGADHVIGLRAGGGMSALILLPKADRVGKTHHARIDQANIEIVVLRYLELVVASLLV